MSYIAVKFGCDYGPSAISFFFLPENEESDDPDAHDEVEVGPRGLLFGGREGEVVGGGGADGRVHAAALAGGNNLGAHGAGEKRKKANG